MPKKTTKGTIVSEIYPARVILTLPPPSKKDGGGTIEFVVAAHHRVGDQDFGAQVQRQPVGFNIAQVADAKAKLSSGRIITGAELVEGVQELFEALHQGIAQPQAAPEQPLAAPARTRRPSTKRK